MELRGLTLSPYQVSQLYTKTLVVLPGTGRPKAPLRYLGEHKEHILILVRDPSAVHLEENSFQLLLSILEACKLSMASVALVNLAAPGSPDPDAVPAELGSRVVLLFGVALEDLPLYEIQVRDGLTYLGVDELASIGAERTLKGRLWACLKQIFQR